MGIQHYENFPVASVLLPGRLRQPIETIYAFARTADDFADEGDALPEERLQRLGQYRHQLDLIEATVEPSLPLFVDLAQIIREYDLPIELFRDLLSAFSQDVVKTRYADFVEVMDYCRRSANPVGRLLLHLFDDTSDTHFAYSDNICSSLQLINFLQDVESDYRRNRIYFPADEMQRFDIAEAQIANADSAGNWTPFMRHQIDRARDMLMTGAPLGTSLKGRIGLELRTIVCGGRRILDKLDAIDGNVFQRRPVLRPFDWIYMLYRSVFAYS
jgi:squalene synthase HpnC